MTPEGWTVGTWSHPEEDERSAREPGPSFRRHKIYGWLIELQASPVCAPLYLAGEESPFWTSDPYRARRFETRGSAAAWAKRRLEATVRICEHGFDR